MKNNNDILNNNNSYNDIELLWHNMSSIRFRVLPEGVVTAEEWHIWKENTSIHEIREWFDNKHSKGLKYLQERI